MTFALRPATSYHGRWSVDHDVYDPTGGDGGLAACRVCLGAEGSLPIHCPGRAMSSDQIEKIYAQELEFANGRWWVTTFECKSKPTADPPEDCGWPTCGCDPRADKVIESLGEQGLLKQAYDVRPSDIVSELYGVASPDEVVARELGLKKGGDQVG